MVWRDQIHRMMIGDAIKLAVACRGKTESKAVYRVGMWVNSEVEATPSAIDDKIGAMLADLWADPVVQDVRQIERLQRRGAEFAIGISRI